MSRIPHPEGTKGSLKWIQRAVNDCPELLQPDGVGPIAWHSPLRSDDLAEYRDAAFLEKIGQAELAPALRAFWPARGPQWDALGTLPDGTPVLVEAKAHVGEFLSPPSQAAELSLTRIKAALSQVQTALGVSPATDWTRVFYQYANRLAHLWFLHDHGVPARLMVVGFLGDEEMRGPQQRETWAALHAAADHALGLPSRHGLSRFIDLVTPRVDHLS